MEQFPTLKDVVVSVFLLAALIFLIGVGTVVCDSAFAMGLFGGIAHVSEKSCDALAEVALLM